MPQFELAKGSPRCIIALIMTLGSTETFSQDELYEAVKQKDHAAVQKILARGADPNKKSPQGWAPLHQAVYIDARMVELLLKKSTAVDIRVSDTNGRQSNRWTALFFAAYLGKTDIADLLLRYGADKNIRDTYEKTADQYARENRHFETANLIMQRGTERKNSK